MELAQAWQMSAEVNRFLLNELPDEALGDAYSSRTRSVAGQFAHMHSVRVRWLTHVAKDLVSELSTFERGAKPSKDELLAELDASEQAISEFLDRCEEQGKLKGWKGPPASFLSYLVAHEAQHRGLAMVAMRLAGRKLPQHVVYGQWDWGKGRSLR
jgi:uncharacterized damage-inducible protein DinB